MVSVNRFCFLIYEGRLKMNNAMKTGQKTDYDRFDELRRSIGDYESLKHTIKTGLQDREKVARQKERIMKQLGASEEQWNDYKWQLRNRFTRVEDICDAIGLSEDETQKIRKVTEKYRFGISPYYLSVIDPDDPDCG